MARHDDQQAGMIVIIQIHDADNDTQEGHGVIASARMRLSINERIRTKTTDESHKRSDFRDVMPPGVPSNQIRIQGTQQRRGPGRETRDKS